MSKKHPHRLHKTSAALQAIGAVAMVAGLLVCVFDREAKKHGPAVPAMGVPVAGGAALWGLGAAGVGFAAYRRKRRGPQ